MLRPRFSLSCATFAALALALASTARAQDDPTPVAKAAAKLLPELRKQLAAGTDDEKRFRLDALADNKDRNRLVVTGVYLQGAKADPKAEGPDAAEKKVRASIEAFVQDKLKDQFKEVLFGEAVKRVPAELHPHVAAQAAANAAAKARVEAANGALVSPVEDRVAFWASRFDAAGALVVEGARADTEAAAAYAKDVLKAALAKHEAAVGPTGTFAATESLKAVKWVAGSTDLQAKLAASDSAVLRACRVERAYVTHDGANAVFRVDGFRLREGKLEPAALSAVLEPSVSATFARELPIKQEALLESVVLEPVDDARKLVAATPDLDGVRVDAGFRFDAQGALVPAGVHPPLGAPARAKLAAVLATGFRDLGRSKQPKEKYEAAARCPLALDPKAEFPFDRVLAKVRELAEAEMDDARASRLYFSEKGQLLLQVRTVAGSTRDREKLDARFKALQTEYLAKLTAPEGTPAPALEPSEFQRSFTKRLREVMAGDQQKWNGVLIERGYFDATGKYTIRGVVDTAAQNDALDTELTKIAAENPPVYGEFVVANNTRAANKPALDVIPMKGLVDRTKRVTPAYAAFDGVRVVGARYDANVNLVFDAHVVGRLDPTAEGFLAQLLREHPEFKRRAPADKLVKIAPVTADPGDAQLADFGLAYGAKLLTKANPSAADKAKARQWLEASRLHYPNEAGVWFLSAYYHHTTGDAELARRDLFRVVELEGPLSFNGPIQRKRRSEAAKDLQGPARADLDALWLDAFRAVKDGERPMAMTARK